MRLLIVFLLVLVLLSGCGGVQPLQRVSATTSSDVRAAARKAGYGSIADRLANASRPAMVLRPRPFGPTPATLGSSRSGGIPDLPAGVKWPRCKGRPQSFLGQIRVLDLPVGAWELRRHGGVLLFFGAIDFAPDEPEYADWAGCSAVIHARAGARLIRTKAPGPGALRLRVARLRFASLPDVPALADLEDHLMPPLQDIVPKGGSERWFDFRYALNGRSELESRLLGYPRAPNGGNACSARMERPTNTWRHLFTVGPDDAIGFAVADAGAVQYLISPKDLAAGRFDRVCAVFDSA